MGIFANKIISMGKGDIKTRKGKIHRGSFGKKRSKKKKKQKIKTNIECIYCGNPTISKNRALKLEKKTGKYPNLGLTKDHVPQQCLYDGYEPKYKANRYTVPACRKCNEELSNYEAELRDFIGVANENDAKQESITKNAVKNILSKSDGNKRLRKDENGKVIGVEFDYNKLQPSHIKNFKGVYYKTYGKRLADSFEVNVVDIDLKNGFEEQANKFLDKNSNWKHSGHEDIFKYRIELVKADASGELVKANNSNEAIMVLCQLVYHQNYAITVIGSKKKLKTRKIN